MERQFYETHYSEFIEKQNERNAKIRHTERNRSIPDLLSSRKTCPEETIYQLGTMDDHASAEDLLSVVTEFIEKFKAKYGDHVHVLDWALHLDESTPHIHERHVFDCENKYGEVAPQQEKALEALGFDLPDPDKSLSRRNNRKISFDAACRKMLFEIAKRHGLELEEEAEYGNRKYLEKQDFILAKQKQEAEQVKAEKEVAEADRDAAIRETDNAKSEHEKLQIRNEEKQRRSEELDSEIAEKEERAREVDRENTDSIKSGIANLFGKGKYAAIEQENERLKAENEHIKESFPDEVRKEVAKRTKALTEAKRTVELERDSAMAIADTYESERDTALRQLREQKTGEQHRISMAVSRATAEKDKTIRQLQGALKSSRDILNIIADILYKASEVFRRAIEAIIHFATERHKSIFSPSEAADIKSVMQSYGETIEQRKAVGTWLCDYAEHRQPFDEIKHRHTLNEVSDVAEGRYDWKIESGRGGISL